MNRADDEANGPGNAGSGPGSFAEQVREFHRAYGLGIATAPTPRPENWKLRIELLREEFEEYIAAAGAGDLVEVADALADMVYVIYGTACEYGIPLDAVLDEVHRSNMSKLGADGRPVIRDDGKVLKGPAYRPPDLAPLLAASPGRPVPPRSA